MLVKYPAAEHKRESFPFRYFGVCKVHSNLTSWTKPSRVKWQILIIYILAVLYNLPVYFEERVVWMARGEFYFPVRYKWSEYKWYKSGYRLVFYYLLTLIIPTLILVYTTFHLIKSLKSMKEKKKAMTTSQDQSSDEGLTMSLIAVVVIFLICNFTIPTRRLLVEIYGIQMAFCGHKLYPFSALTATFHIFNGSVNVIVYLLFGRTFRKKALSKLSCGLNKVEPSSGTAGQVSMRF